MRGHRAASTISGPMSVSDSGRDTGPPPDHCPFPRPFPADFSACPMYQEQRFVAATTREQPLGMHLSCVHLRVGEHAHNRFYAQCALGTAADRRAWLRQVGERRVETMRRLSVEFTELYGGQTEPLLAAKAAAISSPDDPQAAEELERRLADLSTAMDHFLETESGTLEEIGFPVATLRVFIDDVLERWRESPRLSSPPISEDQLEGFPPELRSFLGGSPREQQQLSA